MKNVHIYYSEIEPLRSHLSSVEALSLLSTAEKEQHGRFRSPDQAEQYLFAHFLIRVALTLHNPDVPRKAWAFEKDAYGKPTITNSPAQPHTHFSVSHCAGFIACAISNFAGIGVDAEPLSREAQYIDLAREYFASSEIEAVEQASNKAAVFFQHWTLKEAFAKATGNGLSMSLSKAFFDIDGFNQIRASLDKSLNEDSNAWTFLLRKPTGDHVAALAAKARDLTIKEDFIYKFI